MPDPVLRGAYGMTLAGLPGQQWLGATSDDWVPWRFEVAAALPDGTNQLVGPDGALLALRPHGMAAVNRTTRTTAVHTASPPPAAAFVHPLLVTTAAMLGEWSGRLVFHAGSFLDHHGRAWALLGDREHGKSTALAWLAQRGHPVVADDLLITDGQVVLAGPRCLDLRQGAHERFGLGEDIGVVGNRRRWRAPLADVPPTVPLGGLVILDWAPDVGIDHIAVKDKVQALAPHRGMRVGQRHGVAWLRLLTTPLLRFRRPQDWSELDRVMEHLVAVTDAAPSRMRTGSS